MGPRRSQDLLESLTGIGTILLAARLKTLQSAWVIEAVVLKPPATLREPTNSLPSASKPLRVNATTRRSSC
jgi:DNA-binding HxlR family transcriptional regulator